MLIRTGGPAPLARDADTMNRQPGRTATLIVDRTHLGRRASGIERITEELFSEEALSPLPVEGFGAASTGKLAVASAQMARAPLAMMARPATVWAFSGFPPSPLAAMFRERAVMYVHDLFLITRRQDLNRAAKLYMSVPFRIAVERLRYFLVNSATTGDNLAPYLKSDAEIRPYRPTVRNVFGLTPGAAPKTAGAPLVLGAVGTVEPRKDFPAAAAIARELGRRMGRPVEFHIVGRAGWGDDHAALAVQPHVRLHGFLPEDEARRVIGGFDALICTSHDEGLGLPLIEAQYGGLQAIAPDKPVFREVLGTSGLFIDPLDIAGAAAVLEGRFAEPGWRERAGDAAAANIVRWNVQAADDHGRVIAFLAGLLDAAAR